MATAAGAFEFQQFDNVRFLAAASEICKSPLTAYCYMETETVFRSETPVVAPDGEAKGTQA